MNIYFYIINNQLIVVREWLKILGVLILSLFCVLWFIIQIQIFILYQTSTLVRQIFMEDNFICFTCQQKPMQFTILLCDHLICSKCLDSSLKRVSEICMVQCRCGMKTYCNEDSMKLSLRTPQMVQIKRQLQKVRQIENQNTRISNFVINESDFSSKVMIFSKDKENINNQNQKYSFNPLGANYSKYFLKTQPLNLDESNPFIIDEKSNYQIQKNNIKGVHSVQSIKSISSSQRVSQVVSPKKQKQKTTMKKHSTVSNIISTNMCSSTQSMSSISKQFQKELKFTSIKYDKQVQVCRKTFKKILKSIHNAYEKTVAELQTFYLQQIVEIQSTEKDNILLALPKTVMKKYESCIGEKLLKLNQKLMHFFETKIYNVGKKASQRQILSRQTVFLASDIDSKHNTSSVRSPSVKSKQKTKQCALYLAISPKEKNHRVINYIDVIRKETNKLQKKSTLNKKGFKVVQKLRLI